MKSDESAKTPALVFPKKRLGQHFLTDRRIASRIIEALAPGKDETIIEIGPGTGALTRTLLEKAGRVVAVEFDIQLTPILQKAFAQHENFRVIQADALTTDFCFEIQPSATARLVANLPYNISTAILQHLITQRHCVTEMVVMLQKEVVDRILAPAGSSERGYLSVLIEAYCETEKLFDVAPGSFRPPPKIWSSVLRVKFRPKLKSEVKTEAVLWALVSAGFAQKRKTILNNLRHTAGPFQELIKAHGGASIVLCRAGVELQRRAETLTVEEWAEITRTLE